MTKEKLYKKVYECISENGKYEMANIVLDKFFEQNVVTPKGKNRNPYADVLHEWVEGAEIESKQPSGWWAKEPDANMFFNVEFRIKPSEPVYEWQWYRIINGHVEILNQNSFDGEHQFFTENEVNTNVWLKFEKTKRERIDDARNRTR